MAQIKVCITYTQVTWIQSIIISLHNYVLHAFIYTSSAIGSGPFMMSRLPTWVSEEISVPPKKMFLCPLCLPAKKGRERLVHFSSLLRRLISFQLTQETTWVQGCRV